MSLQASLDPTLHARCGAALRPLRDQGVLVMGSGMSYHARGLRDATQVSVQFHDWLDATLEGNWSERTEGLARWRTAPGGRACHPREEHLLPLMVASGAGSDRPARNLWRGWVGDSRIGAWAFD
jgi:aromatic ring-opening dioxygenase catalytic subunit (LigB family)